MLKQTPHFTSPPTSAQFAMQGAWEQAWSFAIDDLPSDARVCAYLGQSTEVAFEAFFGPAFFGARCTGQAADVEAFALQCVQALRASSRQPFFTALGAQLQWDGGDERIAFAEIGCVNAWRSVGAVRIAHPCDALLEFDHLWRTVENSPVGCDTHHPKAIEFAFEQPLAQWFGIPISDAEAPYPISRAMLHDAMRLAGALAQSRMAHP